LIVSLACTATRAAELIPRRVLFGNPERAGVQVSPDGRRISYLAPVDGVMNVWVAPADNLAAAKPVTKDTKRGIRQHFWAYTSQHVLYPQDENGDENWNIFCTDVSSGQTRNLTPNPKVQAQIHRVSDQFPDEILVGINDRDARFHDVHRVNIRTGKDQLVLKNPDKIGDELVDFLVCDDDYRVRFAFIAASDGGVRVYAVSGGDAASWNQVDYIPMEDAMATGPQGFDKAGRYIFVTDSRNRDTAALVSIDTRTGDRQVVSEDERSDATDILTHPTEKNVQAVRFEHARREWKVVDPAVQADFDYLKTVVDGDLEITSRTQDDKTWVVAYVMDDGPVRFYRYDRPAKKATFLFTNRPALEKVKLSKMQPVVIKSRDGLDLFSYLTLPVSRGKTENPAPMVLFVHGGPWSRDSWGLNSTHQWLANRGYAVLSVNYRGSTGFGKKFVNAANLEWGGKMHDDLIDAVKWAIDKGYAQKDKVAIMGGSYGGYATLVGMTFTPDVFACGVDIVGISNLKTFMATIPPYWESGRVMWRTRMGDESTPEGQRLLESRSPITFVDKIKRPLLIGHGKNDPRVKEAESQQIVKTMHAKKLPVTYVLYEDEGHGFGRPENRLSFNAVAEQFLAEHLGGSAQPVGDDFKGSSIAVPVGAENVKGLKTALGK
jgi:dipeptidyl aminopeptidase/acylaminoacyl peptidase